MPDLRPVVDRFTFPDDCGVVTVAGSDLTIDAVVADIRGASHEPLCIRAVPFADRVPSLEPVEFVGYLCPKRVGVGD